MKANISKQAQPWIHSAFLDGLFIIAPPFLAVALVFSLSSSFEALAEVPFWAWIAVVLCVDVAHVYGSLFRAYFNPQEFRENRGWYISIPLMVWFGGIFLYKIDPMLFWRVVAYLAAFHFIRQHYGFMRIYSRNEPKEVKPFQWIDKTLIYLCTLYPMVYWHTHLPRKFHWYAEGDFVDFIPRQLLWITLIAYVLAVALYLAKEAYFFHKTSFFSLPKQLVLLGTAAAWYSGIVAHNGPTTFAIAILLSHGVPYIGLIWIYGMKQSRLTPNQSLILGFKFSHFFSFGKFPLFFGILILFAYLEEGLWSKLVEHSHPYLFPLFSGIEGAIGTNHLVWLVPLLSLPQVTHIFLDGLIWKMRNPDSLWQKTLL